MKKLLLLIIICLGSQLSNAQDPDPDLFRTWYLYEIQASDLDDLYVVSQINPPITPFFTISQSLEFNGEGACNTFMGSYSYTNGEFLSTNLISTDDQCATQTHNSFEGAYFFFMQNFFMNEITSDSEGLTLHITNWVFGNAIFKDYELSVSENEISKISIAPNPVTETLFILSEGTPIETLSIYSIAGQLVLSEKVNTDKIDVSTLDAGLYFVEVSTSEGKSIRKFIKK